MQWCLMDHMAGVKRFSPFPEASHVSENHNNLIEDSLITHNCIGTLQLNLPEL